MSIYLGSYLLTGLCIWWSLIRVSHSMGNKKDKQSAKNWGFLLFLGWPIALVLVICVVPLIFIDWASNKEIF